jgi:pantoate--beta-alanine ligase
MKIVCTIGEARPALAALPRPLGLVPTMGALHEGHLSLVDAARERCATVVASLFVNPTQFGPDEDFARYPRDERRDLALFAEHGVDLVFAPRPDDMYPQGFATLVHVGGPLTEAFEGAARTGHFDGVTTVVTKLLTIVAPDMAFFGQKDAQQLAVIRRLVADLDLPVEVVAVETVREPDGLAMSSRNVYLNERERQVAARLHQALLAGSAAAAGASPPDVVAAVAAALAGGGADGTAATAGGPPHFAVEYVAVVDAATFRKERILGPRSLLVVAAHLGTTRFIDNVSLAPASPGEPRPVPKTSAYLAKDATA